jgi:hypothetical protein
MPSAFKNLERVGHAVDAKTVIVKLASGDGVGGSRSAPPWPRRYSHEFSGSRCTETRVTSMGTVPLH